MRVPVAVAVVAVANIALLAGCEDIRRFQGVWAGPVSADPAHRQGFPPTADGSGSERLPFLRATVGTVSRRGIEMTLDIPEHGNDLRFEPIRHAADDVLGDLRIEGEPLRTFLGYVRPKVGSGESFLTIVSLFAEDRIDVRIIRGPDEIYGVFSLRPLRETIP